MAAIIALVMALVTGIIGFVIVDSVESAQSWNLTLSGTIAQYIVPIGLLGLLGAAATLS